MLVARLTGAEKIKEFCKETKMLAKQLLVVCLFVSAVAIVGCEPTLVGTDGAAYQSGKLYASSSKDVDAVYQAALKAVEKLQLNVASKANDAFGANVIAKTSDGKDVWIFIKPSEDKKTTRYSIKVGTLGDEERSRKIYAEMDNAMQSKSK
jgi:hypothetical protein